MIRGHGRTLEQKHQSSLASVYPFSVPTSKFSQTTSTQKDIKQYKQLQQHWLLKHAVNHMVNLAGHAGNCLLGSWNSSRTALRLNKVQLTKNVEREFKIRLMTL